MSYLVSQSLKRALAAATGAAMVGWVRAAVGAVSRWISDKLAEHVSVADFATVQEAVTHAHTTGVHLYWPEFYTVAASIANLHDVKHSGPGGLIRGTDTFYASPKEGQENILYVSPTGSDANDGITAALPFATTQAAFDVLMKRAYLGGTWRVKHAAGTYTGSAKSARLGPANETETTPNTDSYKNNGVVSKNFIVIEGPDVGYDPATNPWPTPTAIFDGAAAAAVGMQFEGGKLLVKNIKFIDYNGSTSSGGIVGDATHVRTENVHASGCYYGISNFMGRLEVKGGDIYGSVSKQYTGIRSMFLNKHEIGNQGAGGIGQGPRIRYCSIGLLAQEAATGHSDYVQYEDCNDAIRATVNSRVNYSGSDFKRCARAVRADANSVVYESGANYNDGTADACTENVVVQQGAVDLTRDTYSNSAVATDYLSSSVTVTGTVVSTPVLTKTLKRGRFAPTVGGLRKPQHIRITAFGSMSGTAGTKQFKVRLGATNLGVVTNAAADTGSFKIEAEVLFLSKTAQKGGISYFPHISSIRSNYGAGAIDMAAADVDLNVEVQLTNSADSVTIDHCVVEVFG